MLKFSKRKEFDSPLENVHGPSEYGFSRTGNGSAYENCTCADPSNCVVSKEKKPATSVAKSRVRTREVDERKIDVLEDHVDETFGELEIAVSSEYLTG